MSLSLKARALRFLAAREHSRSELAKKLARYEASNEHINAVLDGLQQAGILSDERFVESLIHRRAARFGSSRIIAELAQHGIERERLGELKSTLLDDEVARAIQVLRKRFAAPPSDAGERAKRIRFLSQRGFSHAAVRAALAGADHDEDDLDWIDSTD